MADDFTSILPPDESTSWLARNRKIVILGGLAILLGGAALATAILPRHSTNKNTSPLTNQTSNSAAPINAYDRPTFQRSTVPDVPTTIPPAYHPPTNSDLQQAIQQLQQNTNH